MYVRKTVFLKVCKSAKFTQITYRSKFFFLRRRTGKDLSRSLRRSVYMYLFLFLSLATTLFTYITYSCTYEHVHCSEHWKLSLPELSSTERSVYTQSRLTRHVPKRISIRRLSITKAFDRPRATMPKRLANRNRNFRKEDGSRECASFLVDENRSRDANARENMSGFISRSGDRLSASCLFILYSVSSFYLGSWTESFCVTE